MPLPISSAAIQEKNKLEGGGTWIVLIDIAVPGLEDNIRVTSDNQETVWNGNTYVPFPFEIDEISDSSTGEVPRVDIRVSNVTRAMEAYLQDYDYYTKENGYTPIEMTISVVHSAHLDPCEDGVELETVVTDNTTSETLRFFPLDDDTAILGGIPDLDHLGHQAIVTDSAGRTITAKIDEILDEEDV